MPLSPAHLVLTHPPLAPSCGSGWLSRCTCRAGPKASKAGLSLPSLGEGKFFSPKSPTGPQRPSPQLVTPSLERAWGTLSFQSAWNSHPCITGLEGTWEDEPPPFLTPVPTQHIPILGTSDLVGVGTHQGSCTPSRGSPLSGHTTQMVRKIFPILDNTCGPVTPIQQADQTGLTGSAKWRHPKAQTYFQGTLIFDTILKKKTKETKALKWSLWEKSEPYWTSLYLSLGIKLLNFILPLGGGWARNMIFRGLRLRKIFNNIPGFCSLHLPRGSVPQQTAFQISDDFFHSQTQRSLQFVNIQEALSEQLGEDWGFPQGTQPRLCLSFHSESWPLCLETTISPEWVPRRRPQGQWLLLTSWLRLEHPPTCPHQPYITGLEGWGPHSFPSLPSPRTPRVSRQAFHSRVVE